MNDPHRPVVSIRADLRSPSILAFTSSQVQDPIHPLCAPSPCTQQHASFPEMSSICLSPVAFKRESRRPGRSAGAASRLERRRSPTARPRTRLARTGVCCCSESLQKEVRDVWMHSKFKHTTTARRLNGRCHRNDSDEARKHKKLRPAFV